MPECNRTANFQTAADVMAPWREDVLEGQPPVLYPVGTGGLARLEIGPKLVTLVGGAPGAGKTAFIMQCAVDALRLTPELRVCICNVEMSPQVLMDRQLARLSGIDLTTIRYRRFDAMHTERIEQAMNTLEPLASRLAFVGMPFDLSNVAATADEFKADMIVLDYIQRIAPPGDHGDRRGSVDATMNFLRQFADGDVAVVVVAAVSRTKDSKGRSSYDGSGLNLASFRESSELEFGADDAFILTPKPKNDDVVILRHLKSRHTEAKDLELRFNRSLQRFTPPAVTQPRSPKDPANHQAAWRAKWDQTPAAKNDDDAVGEQ